LVREDRKSGLGQRDSVTGVTVLRKLSRHVTPVTPVCPSNSVTSVTAVTPCHTCHTEERNRKSLEIDVSAYSIPIYDSTRSRELPVKARTCQPVRALGLNYSIPLLGGPPTCAEIWAALASHFQSP
jgi:hypothetical protein